MSAATRNLNTVSPDESPLDADGYIGVSPEYQNHANKTDAPLEPSDEDEVEAGEDEKVPAEDAESKKAPEVPADPPAVTKVSGTTPKPVTK